MIDLKPISKKMCMFSYDSNGNNVILSVAIHGFGDICVFLPRLEGFIPRFRLLN